MDRMRVHPLAELCIKAVDEATIAELNEQWMEKEGPTDVLAFPMDELRPGLVNEEPEEGVLGDLVLCPAVAERQGDDGRPRHRGRDRAADRARHPAPARLRPRRARGAPGDVRAPGRAARRVAAAASTGDLLDDSGCSSRPPPSSLLAGLFSGRRRRARRRSPGPAPRSWSPRAGPARGGWSTLLDDRARYLNTALLLRLLCEIAAIVLVTQLVTTACDGAWLASVLLTSIGVMLVVSFVVIGVAPRTLGRQHAERVALLSAAPAVGGHHASSARCRGC